MIVRSKQPWELPDHALTDESAWMNRRQLLAALGFGGVSMLAVGCARADGGPPQEPLATDVLAKFPARHNAAYDPGRPLTAENLASQHNNFYELTTVKDRVHELANSYRHRPWTITVDGLVDRPMTVDVDDLIRRFDQQERHYRFRCVEAWSATIPWTGFPLAGLLGAVGVKSEARYVRFVGLDRPRQLPGQASKDWYPWPYHEGLTVPEALNELSLLVTGVYGKVLPGQHGAPLRLITPWKYGFKQIKAITRIELVAEQPPTFWNKLAADEYDFWGIVDPAIPHKRWSQATERLLDTGERIDTVFYNGYGEQVAGLYKTKAGFGFGT
jgi:sulfoxide reductase catalytic subunit YedY